MIGSGLVSFFLLTGMITGDRSTGRTLHEWLFYLGLYFSIVPALGISAGLFSGERRNQTLELLYLAGINSGELFIGKLLGGALIASGDLLALSPLFAIPFLSGGISLDLFLATIVCFPILLFFILAVGTLGSAVCTDEGAAQCLTVILITFLSLALLIPYSLGLGLYGRPPFSTSWLCLSPAYPPYLVWAKFATAAPAVFWTATVATAGWTLVFLILAAIMLKRNWRKDMERSRCPDAPGIWRSLAQGTPVWRSRLRNRVLESNPFQWLAEQDRRPVVLAWGLIAGLLFFWLGGWAAWPLAWPSCANFYATALVLLVATGWIRHYTAARRIGEDRRDGALELLLTTPLAAKEIVDGQLAALRAQFRPIHWSLLALCAAMMGAGFFVRAWTAPALVSYLLIWLFILAACLLETRRAATKVMWIALNSGRPVYSVFASYGKPWSWFWLVFNLKNILRSFGRGSGNFPSGSRVELSLIILVIVLSSAFYLARRVGTNSDEIRKRLIDEMSSIASDPAPDPKDPRFKKWNTDERFQPRLSYNFPRLPHPFPRETKFG